MLRIGISFILFKVDNDCQSQCLDMCSKCRQNHTFFCRMKNVPLPVFTAKAKLTLFSGIFAAIVDLYGIPVAYTTAELYQLKHINLHW